MSSNSAQIVQQIHHDFKDLVEYVTGEASRSRTAHEVELTLFRRLLALGERNCCDCSLSSGRPSAPSSPSMHPTERA
jgi:hypothetical protein